MTGPKASRRAVAAVVVGLLLIPAYIAAAKTEGHKPKSKTQSHKSKSRTRSHKPRCKAHYVARRVRVRKREHKRVVWVRKWKCVKARRTHTPHQPTSGAGPVKGVGPGTKAPPPPKDCVGTPGSGTPNYSSMDTCGYPSPDTTGVPAGTHLTPSGGITIGTAGEVVNGLAVSGTINVTASDVTIENSNIADADSEGGAIQIAPGVTGTLVKYDTIHGTAATSSGNLQMGVENGNNADDANAVTIDHVDFYDGQRILDGPGTVTNSFCLNNAAVPGAHYECVYEGGGSVTLNHNTLLTAFSQTAVIFVSDDFAALGSVKITNNLLAGGGYTIYGYATNVNAYGIGSETISGNRFSRLYYRTDGYWGPDVYMPRSYTWSGNVWDDTGATISP